MRSVVRVYPGQPKSSQDDAVYQENGALAQLGERLLCKQDVVGSIPSGSTISFGSAGDHRTSKHTLRRKSKETKFAELSCEGRVGGSFDIVKRCSFVPFDPHPGEEQEKHVDSG